MKGSPEYEIHILGPAAKGDTKNLTGFQCIAAESPSPYYWDANTQNWTGKQMLFSKAQIDAFQGAHPGAAMSIMAIEDDDGACQIKTDPARFEALYKSVGAFTNDLKGAVAVPIGVGNYERYLAAARTGYLFLKALWNWITTADDLIGLAVNDAATGRYRSGTNWTFLHEKGVQNGWIQLDIIN